jgi:hypothetical protein
VNPYDAGVTWRPAEPRLPIVGLIGLAALGIGFLAAAYSLPIDDFWLTLASGRAILDGAPFGQAVDFTWTPMVEGALNPQWAAQLILALPGFTGGALAINAALIGIGLLATTARATSRVSGFGVAAAMLLVTAAVAPHLLARAQSFSIALLPVALLLLERFRSRLWLPPAYALLMLVWANVHGAFVVGQVAAGAALVAALIERRRVGVLTATAVAALVAPVANPAGIELLAYAYAQPGLDLIRQISVEWQPAFPWIPLTWLFWVQAVVLVAFRFAQRGKAPLTDMILAAGLLVLAIASLRQIPWFCLATAPMLAADLSTLAGGRLDRLTRVPAWLSGNAGQRTLIIAALVAVAIQPLRPLLPQPIGRVTPDAPVSLAAKLETDLSDGSPHRILNEQVWGGYLVYELDGRIETAMDGRIEIRDRATWSNYFSLMRGEDDPAATLAAADVSWAVLARDRATLVDKLSSAGWRTVANSPQGVLMAAP